MPGLTLSPLRLALAVIGPMLGIALWYWIDHGLGRPELALFVGAGVIYLVARLGVLTSIGDSVVRHLGYAVCMVAIVGACFWALIGVGVSSLVALAISLLAGGIANAPIARAVIPMSAGVGSPASRS